jgi:hypothetical protein
MMYRNKKLTESARHEVCVSCGAPNSVWCHSNEYLHGKGRSMKANDIFGFYGCIHCHDWYDGRSTRSPPSTNLYENKYKWFRDMWEHSMIIACEKGYLK